LTLRLPESALDKNDPSETGFNRRNRSKPRKSLFRKTLI